ncbi:hypothetical protein CARUB_v10027754mg, partial [Capsella rubella]
CGEREDMLHLLLKCLFAVKVWELVPAMFKPQASFASVKDLLGVVKILLILPPMGLGSVPLYPWLLWYLWKCCNLLVFEDKGGSEEDTMGSTPAIEVEVYTCCSDVAWKDSTRVGGFGWVIKDPQKHIVLQGSASRSFVTSALLPEALAMEVAIKSVLAMGVSRVACYSECKELVLLLQSGGSVNELVSVLADIVILCSSFSYVSFLFIPRLENALADALAKEAYFSVSNSSL